MKVLYLLYIHTKSFFHKVRSDLMREIVIGFSTLILLSLFYYVFNDFLNTELKKISTSMRETFAEALAAILLLSLSWASGKSLRSFFKNQLSLLHFSKFLGEKPWERKVLAFYHIFLTFLFFYTPGFWIVQYRLVSWPSRKVVLIFFGAMTLSLIIALLRKNTRENEARKLILASQSSALKTLVLWRLQILCFRNRLSQFCFFLAGIFLCLHLIAIYLHFPFPSFFLICFGSGLLTSCSLSFQFSEDLKSSDLEKSSGVSHKDYLLSLCLSSAIVAIFIGGIFSATYFLFKLILSENSGPLIFETLKIFFMTALPSFLVPNVFFQIDGRRAFFPILTTFLLSLFVSSAIYASMFSLVLFPIIAYYGWTSQNDRFYRA